MIVEAPGAPAGRQRFIALAAEAAREPEGEPNTAACLGDADWQALAGARGLRTLDLSGCEPVPRFVTATRPGAALAAYLEGCLGRGQRVILAARSQRDLSRLERRVPAGALPSPERVDRWEAARSGSPGIAALQARFGRGFVDRARNLVVVTADDLLGSTAATGNDAPSAAALWQVEIAELHLGDVVVHADHGVGRLEGLEPVAAGEVGGEAIRLRYDRGETLLVPTAEAGKLWRYGSEDTDVALTRLSGNAWSKRREKAAAAVAETGRRLVAEMNERRARSAPKLLPPLGAYERFAARFPFRLTSDQAGAIAATLADLGAGSPMNRLVFGDVGFGKTEVALRGRRRRGVFAGRQVAIAAPTTVLVAPASRDLQAPLPGPRHRGAELSRFVAASRGEAVQAGAGGWQRRDRRRDPCPGRAGVPSTTSGSW